MVIREVIEICTQWLACFYHCTVEDCDDPRETLIYGVDVPGYATTLGVVLLLGGIQLLVIGIMGEYLARVYIQGKHRPIYIEKESLRMHND